MFRKTTEEEFIELAKTEKKIAVFRELSGDQLTPSGIFHALSDGNGALLESAAEGPNSRYSFMGFDPIVEFRATGNRIEIKKEGNTKVLEKDPFAAFKEVYEEFKCKSHSAPTRFTGGTIGFVSYDAIRSVEVIPDRHPEPDPVPDLFFPFYRITISFDHLLHKLFITVLSEVNGDPKEAFELAESTIDEVIEKIRNSDQKISTEKVGESSDLEVDIDDEAYKKMVEKAKEYVTKGDVFQVVLSRRFQKKLSVRPFDLYRALRITSPSPYMFYIETADFTVTGASPEELVSVRDGVVQTTPLAGTIARGNDDEAAIETLMNDEKELAEHMMLVDLGRNDLGSIAKPGSVKVKELSVPKKFPNVIHIASVVTGDLAEGLTGVDALRKIFPAGTLSGAPKIRAMEIIDELESSRRGVYGGAICAIDHLGNLESCIAIRMAVIKDGVVTVRAGAGIVHDSVPDKEAKETRLKAKSVLNAIEFAEGGNL